MRQAIISIILISALTACANNEAKIISLEATNEALMVSIGEEKSVATATENPPPTSTLIPEPLPTSSLENVEEVFDEKSLYSKIAYNNSIFSIRSINDKDRILGTGFAITNNHVLTNFHVVHTSNIKGNNSIAFYAVTFDEDSNEHRYLTEIAGVDKTKDLALLQITDKKLEGKLNPLVISNKIKSTDIGEKVFAIGYPLGLSDKSSISSGIVSQIFADRKITHLQHDAQLFGGNSGGPLILNNGTVIGVNTMGFIDPNSKQMLGIAVAISHLKTSAENPTTISLNEMEMTPYTIADLVAEITATAEAKPFWPLQIDFTSLFNFGSSRRSNDFYIESYFQPSTYAWAVNQKITEENLTETSYKNFMSNTIKQSDNFGQTLANVSVNLLTKLYKLNETDYIYKNNKNILEPQSFEDSLWVCSISYGVAKVVYSPIIYKMNFSTQNINASCQKDWNDFINLRVSSSWIDFVTGRSAVKQYVGN
ncbi:serine protease [Dehalococcoidia bacterium]|nr:serine protease [Dehalococcoidia bacterium]